MKVFLHTGLRVITDNPDSIIQLYKELLPVDFETEKLRIHADPFTTSNDEKHYVVTLALDKQRHIALFTKQIFEQVPKEIIQKLLAQLETRVDEECSFFVRFALADVLQQKFTLTQSGNCLHLTFAIASYPKRRDVAVATVKEYLESLV